MRDQLIKIIIEVLKGPSSSTVLADRSSGLAEMAAFITTTQRVNDKCTYASAAYLYLKVVS